MTVTYSNASHEYAIQIMRDLEFFAKLPNNCLQLISEEDNTYIEERESEDVLYFGVTSDFNLKPLIEHPNFWVEELKSTWCDNHYPYVYDEGVSINDWHPNLCISLDMFILSRNPKRWYQNYLNSPRWIEKRNEALYLADYKCSRCGERENLHVHHLNYDSIGNESQADLFVCCKDCHKLFHVKKAKTYAK